MGRGYYLASYTQEGLKLLYPNPMGLESKYIQLEELYTSFWHRIV